MEVRTTSQFLPSPPFPPFPLLSFMLYLYGKLVLSSPTNDWNPSKGQPTTNFLPLYERGKPICSLSLVFLIYQTNREAGKA